MGWRRSRSVAYAGTTVERDPALRKVWIRDWLKLVGARRPLISEAVDEITGLVSGPWWR